MAKIAIETKTRELELIGVTYRPEMVPPVVLRFDDAGAVVSVDSESPDLAAEVASLFASITARVGAHLVATKAAEVFDPTGERERRRLTAAVEAAEVVEAVEVAQ